MGRLCLRCGYPKRANTKPQPSLIFPWKKFCFYSVTQIQFSLHLEDEKVRSATPGSLRSPTTSTFKDWKEPRVCGCHVGFTAPGCTGGGKQTNWRCAASMWKVTANQRQDAKAGKQGVLTARVLGVHPEERGPGGRGWDVSGASKNGSPPSSKRERAVRSRLCRARGGWWISGCGGSKWFIVNIKSKSRKD